MPIGRRSFSPAVTRSFVNFTLAVAVFSQATEMLGALSDPLDPSRLVLVTLRDLRATKPSADARLDVRDQYRVATLHFQQLLDRLRQSGYFDEGRLTVAAADTQVYIDHLPLEDPIRRRLVRDLQDLKRLREKHSASKSMRTYPDLQ